MMSAQTVRRALAFVVLTLAECIVFAWLEPPLAIAGLVSFVGGGALALSWKWREIQFVRRQLRADRRRPGPPLEWID